MKKLILGLIFLIGFNLGYTQEGMRFVEGTWSEVLDLAKKENKPIFVDVYTSWCVPCKKMAAEIFTQESVGNYFNEHFINYKFDAEKGEGVALAAKYGVRSYPTYLFINPDSQMVYRSAGYMPAPSFLKEALIAVQESTDPKPFVQWEAEYEKGNRDKSFMLGYLKKRALLKLPSPQLIDDFFSELTLTDLMDPEILSSIYFSDSNIQFVPNGKAFTYLLGNHKKLDSLKLVRYPLGILEMGINNYYRKVAIPQRQEDMIGTMRDAQKKVMTAANIGALEQMVMEKELALLYYKASGTEEQMLTAVKDYVQNGLKKYDIQKLLDQDQESFKKFMEPYRKGEKDSISDENFLVMKRLTRNNAMVSISYKLRDAAEAVYDGASQNADLELAKSWANEANTYFPHFSNGAVYAGLLFKTGQEQEAIRVMEVATRDEILKNAQEVHARLLKNLDVMKRGIAPGSLWK